MAQTYQVRLYVWPYHGVKREPAPYMDSHIDAGRGERDPVVNVEAENFQEACDKAKQILVGVRLDERVWNAGIVDIRKDKP